MLKRILAGLMVAVALASGAVAGPAEDADTAYQHGDYATALKLTRPLAEQGDAFSQANLGSLYDRAQNYAEALKWYRLAARR